MVQLLHLAAALQMGSLMLVVNLFAGPSIGKSLLASDIFTKLKRLGVQAEIPPEVAKIRAQRGDYGFLADQLAVFGETQHQINMAHRSGAEVVVLDSPILLSLVYAPKPYLQTFPAIVRETYALHQNLVYVLPRNPKHGYSPVGRVHNEAESIQKDMEIVEMLHDEGIDFENADTSEDSAQRIVTRVIHELEKLAEKPEQQYARQSERA